MIILFNIALLLPLTALGAVCLFAPHSARRMLCYLRDSKQISSVMTVIAWFWAAYECHIIGIDVFDMVLKIFPGEVWILAAVLSFLTILWMQENLFVRALSGLLMLFPARYFALSFDYLPSSGFAPIHISVIVTYILTVAGMYGMFYPWRIEKAASWLLSGDIKSRMFGTVLFVVGLSVAAALPFVVM
jgi:uncharacterized protein YjeT (DUF2065 family)